MSAPGAGVPSRARAWAIAFAAAGALSLAGCADVSYYWQSASGHVKLMNAAKPVPEWLADPATPEPLKARLALTQRIRDYAITELALPRNASYRRYADLHRPAAVWNVVAAPPYSLTLKTWCFPVLGCVGYHGYFDLARADAEAQSLRAEGLEATVYPVPAYSTLGWLNWLGGDPLLNTFIGYPEGELARLVFHELAHQVAYAPGDTAFNESFATSVERIGSQRWLATQASEAARVEYAAWDRRRNEFRDLMQGTRKELEVVYADTSLTPERMEAAKRAAMERFHARYAQLKRGWGGYAGYDAFVAKTNNALLGAQAAYDDLVPAFEALFEREGRDFPRFYAAVKRLAALPEPERRAALALPAK